MGLENLILSQLCGVLNNYFSALISQLFVYFCNFRWTGANRSTERKCPHCDEKFTKSYSLSRHVAVKHSERRFDCDQCDYKAKLPTLLAKHKRRLHR